MRLSILDYSPVDEGLQPSDALAATVRLAQHVEEKGFKRYWVSEHHGMPATASNSPEILMGRIASATSRIRVGSGGVLIPNYSSLKLAENYQLLEAMFPNRIDLGFGRAPGAHQRTTSALNDEKREALPYPQKVSDLMGFITGDHLPGSRYAGMQAHPLTAGRPQPFVLGASGSTAEFAAQMGLGFTFAHFINPTSRGPNAAKAYRAAFRPSGFSETPDVVVAIFVSVGETEEEAQTYADAFHLWLSHAESMNPFERVPSLATTRNHHWEPHELAVRQQNQGRLISGTGPQVVAQLRALADAYGTDEVMINLMMPGEQARLEAVDAIVAAMSAEPAEPASVKFA
ncbi:MULTISPECIES: LLM class flavin-dependent oxidoreductase [Rhizobium/Agrobacterium group]|uniref:LLM class flavin-dependent oxidoreductase n=1 Tax=Rhizobium/Agrobacterium group TaxID=227290 RepID=UPI001ADAB510|nr:MULTISPECIES: LLM class flavin-dependent oxidoreductase [Rhizobium/Agrobacterium group]MBO9112466.1 LLM class flavin-dependent oxidoreductase [Agrobacterium sp. S2/73]QXZ75975.1 LLM class flavin-dependent oxidoreductase [Agrobacterium sp. S7/73]QYA17014.1 LLM class flavin-dependent oxidoreductase [Rhizobium sp. AB2/73]UEQ85413.1 LLM class flavin-dependent oxidoreductase [Rhizobium sp. AB2/73]